MAKVLLVEDDNNLREIYEARLQAEGYTIVSASDGEEALVVAKAEKPDLIISDVMMPKISGFEMLDILRNTDGLKEVKVIMLTALGQNEDQQRADRLGADRYLVKSQVTLEDIIKTAHELLNDKPGEAAAPSAEPAAPTAPASPAPEPEPEPAPEPTPAPTEAAAPAEEPKAQSEAQEEAAVEAKIEDFVAGASEEATPPSDSPTAAPTEPATEAAAPEPAEPPSEAPASSEASVANDKLIDNAVQTLSDDQAKANDDAPVVIKPSEPAVDQPAEEAEKPGASDNNVAIAHKKVIEPIDSEPKKSLDELLAKEEAKEGGGATPDPSSIVVSTDDKSKPGDDGKVDPHSIAL